MYVSHLQQTGMWICFPFFLLDCCIRSTVKGSHRATCCVDLAEMVSYLGIRKRLKCVSSDHLWWDAASLLLSPHFIFGKLQQQQKEGGAGRGVWQKQISALCHAEKDYMAICILDKKCTKILKLERKAWTKEVKQNCEESETEANTYTHTHRAEVICYGAFRAVDDYSTVLCLVTHELSLVWFVKSMWRPSNVRCRLNWATAILCKRKQHRGGLHCLWC